MTEYVRLRTFLDVGEYNFSNGYLLFEMVLFSLAGFFIPFFIGHPQIFIGALVNAFLISSALKLPNWKVLPIIILPSLGVLSRGLVFGPYTQFLLYMIPFIWIGNYILVVSFRKLKLERKMHYWKTLTVGVLLKSGFLFIVAYFLVRLHVLPTIFITAMGVLQVVTGFAGGVLSFIYEKLYREGFSRTDVA